MDVLSLFDIVLFKGLIYCFFFIYGALALLPEKNNILRILFMFEMLILIISCMFLLINLHYMDIYGQIAVMYLLTIAAVEAAIGLALIYVYYRRYGTIRLESLEKIKG